MHAVPQVHRVPPVQQRAELAPSLPFMHPAPAPPTPRGTHAPYHARNRQTGHAALTTSAWMARRRPHRAAQQDFEPRRRQHRAGQQDADAKPGESHRGIVLQGQRGGSGTGQVGSGGRAQQAGCVLLARRHVLAASLCSSPPPVQRLRHPHNASALLAALDMRPAAWVLSLKAPLSKPPSSLHGPPRPTCGHFSARSLMSGCCMNPHRP